MRGLALTQMSDIGNRLGVSAGNLYNYVDSKETLFWWCLRAAAHEVDLAAVDLPLTSPPRDIVLKDAGTLLHGVGALAALDAALVRKRVHHDRVEEELRGVVEELYDLNLRYRDLLGLVEQSARALPELHGIFYADFRGNALARIEEYIARRARSGHLLGEVDPAVAARAIVESTAWFARHRLGDPDGHLLDEVACRETVITMCTRSLLR